MSIPADIHQLLDQIVEVSQDLLGDDRVGVYLHGSLAMGCFNRERSDVDFLVVARHGLDNAVKRRLATAMLRLSDQAPPQGLEMSVVTQAALRAFEHPTPYEFHFSNAWKEKYAEGCVDFDVPQRDGDLAAHLVITRCRGRALCGRPIEEVFPEVPREAYVSSIVADARESIGNVNRGQCSGACEVPVYGVLNFCRVLAFLEQGLIASKAEGGRWALGHLPARYHGVVSEALREYESTGSAAPVAAVELQQFASWIQDRLDRLG